MEATMNKRLSGAAKAAKACKGKKGASFKSCVKSRARGK